MKVPPDIVKFPTTFNVTALELPLASVIMKLPLCNEKFPRIFTIPTPVEYLTLIVPPD